jgi:flagellar biosynthesis component FlhA
VVIASAGARHFLRQIAEATMPNLTVLSHSEIPPAVKVRSRGVIE